MIELKYYTAEWCQPCKRLKPIAEKIAKEYGITFRTLDIEKADVPADIKSVPTIAITDHGNVKMWLTANQITPQVMRGAIERVVQCAN